MAPPSSGGRGDDALDQPTVMVPVVPQVPLGRGSAVPAWNIGDLQEPPTAVTALPGTDGVAPYDPAVEYEQQEYYDGNYEPMAALFVEPLPGGKPRVRKVSRVLRAVDAWSVFKVSIIFYLAMYLVCLIAGVLLWNVAYSTGTIDNLSNFFESFGWKSFQFKGGEIFHNAWILGLFLVVGLTGMNVVLATLFNLIADLVGGIRLTVLEEEVMVRRVDAPGDPTSGATSPLLADPASQRRSARRFGRSRRARPR